MKKYKNFLIECGCEAAEQEPVVTSVGGEEGIDLQDIVASLTTEPEPEQPTPVDQPEQTITPENAAGELEMMANKAIELSNLLRKLYSEKEVGGADAPPETN